MCLFLCVSLIILWVYALFFCFVSVYIPDIYCWLLTCQIWRESRFKLVTNVHHMVYKLKSALKMPHLWCQNSSETSRHGLHNTWCALVSVTSMLAADPLSPVSWKLAKILPWLVVVFHKPFRNHVCNVAGLILLLKEATAVGEYCFYERVYSVCNNV